MKMQHEMKNNLDHDAVAVARYEEDVCHTPLALANTKQGARTICHFLKKERYNADWKSVGKAVNQGDRYDTEVPCVYSFPGQEKYVESL